MKTLFITLCCAWCVSGITRAQGTQPIVAIHDSEFTRALESAPASGATPTGPGTTGNQWWLTPWHYFVMPDAVKEALRSDGTAFTVVGDSNILAGALTNSDGSPKYPILISLAAEAIDDGEIAQLTNYVASGGFLFVGSSSFTRGTNGASRGDFAIASALGIHMVNPALTNWYLDTYFIRISDHPLVTNIPAGTVAWQMPASADEVSWPTAIHLAGETPNAVAPGLPHLIWQVRPADASVIANGDGNIPYLLVKPYGKGYFIYDAAMQPLIGHGGWAPGMYAYGIFRKAIQWAFESAVRPVVKVSPWPYPYDAAVIFRHDMEAIPSDIISIEGSARFEHTNGASGDYYFCTGTLREDMPDPTFSNTVASLQRAVTNYGATVSAHNGGLTNINPVYSPQLVPIEPNLSQLLSEGWLTAFEPYTFPPLAPLNANGTDYDYWHWGPDEILDLTNSLPGGYPNGSAYAFASISNALTDMAGWQLTNGGPTQWVCPYFNSTREGSIQIETQLGIKITGDDKLSPFPSWTLSTQTPDKKYGLLQLPVSDWFIGTQVAQSMENGHTAATMQSLVDYYYNLGGLINLYCHSSSDGSGMDGTLPGDYVTYSLSKPRIWSTNAAGVYAWWLERSNAQVTATFTNLGNQSVTTLGITGMADPNAAVELRLPGAATAVQVSTNGSPAGTNIFRLTGQTVKVQVGVSITNAVISYVLLPMAQDDGYTAEQNTPLNVSAPGVLANDTVAGSGSLTATLVGGPANGTLTLNTNGSFTYTPTNNFVGMDSFAYQAVSGSMTSAVAMVTITVTAPGELFYDTFSRPASDGTIFPWVQQAGSWSITNNALVGSSDTNSYGYAYYNGAGWSDYSVQAQIQFSTNGAWGGGLGGRLNPATGAHYAVWVYPEASPFTNNGTAVMQLVKYSGWTTYTVMAGATLPSVQTAAHTVRLVFQGTNIAVYFDGNPILSRADDGTIDQQPAYTNGTISLNLWTQTPTPYTMTVSNVIVSTPASVANNDAYNAYRNTTLNVSAPGVLLNDTGGAGGLSALLVANPVHGTLLLTNNGGFAYTPANNYTGPDTFTYQATDGQTTSSVATVSITVSLPVVANGDSYTMEENTALTVGAPGILANDTGGAGSLSAILVGGPSHGTLTLTNNGSFGYAPANNFVGSDSFTYRATDGQNTSGVATVTINVNNPPVANNDIYTSTPGTILNVAAPGVLANDTGSGLAALLVSGPVSGGFNLTNNGGFTYQPTNNFAGVADFTYQVTDGAVTSAVAAAAIKIVPTGKLFLDNFTHSPLWPWIAQSGTWNITNNVLTGTNSFENYSHIYLSDTWTDYVAQGRVQFSSTNAWGGGIGGRLTDPVNGAHYATWLYPENSGGATNGVGVLKLIKFHNWTEVSTWTPLAAVALTNNPVGTNWHTLGIAFQGSNIFAYYDGAKVAQVTDDGSFDGQGAFTNGGIDAEMWEEDPSSYLFSLSNVVVAPLVANDSYSVNGNTTLSVPAPGVLANDTDVYGSGLTPVVISGPAHGILSLTNNGGFSYTPTNNFTGADSFVYQASSGTTNLGTATVTITVVPVLTVTANNQSRPYGATNPVFTVSYSGFVNGDNTNILSGTPSASTGAITNSPVGSYPINISQGTLSAPGYNLAFVNGALTVTQAVLTVGSGITANNKVYDGTTAATITSNNVVLNGVLPGDNVKPATNGYTANFSGAGVGTNITVTVSGLTLIGANATNYSLTQPAGLKANITGLNITVSSGIGANSKVYDGTTSATIFSNNVVLNGVLAGDAANVRLSTNGYTASFAGAGVGTNIAVTVGGLTLTGSAAANYSLAQPAGLIANITGAGVTITSGISANNKVYDGTTTATIVSNNVVLSGLLDGDTNNVGLSTNGYAANFAGAGVGTNLAVTVSGLTLTGPAATNYTLVQPAGLIANITGAGVAITSGISANNKVYDGTTTATISSNGVVLSGLADGDTNTVRLSTNGYSANFASPGAANGIGITISGLTLTGASAANYSLSQPTGLTASITTAGVSIASGVGANNKVYDGTTVATISSNGVVLNGLVDGDTNSVQLSTNDYTASFASAGVGTNLTVTLSGLTLTGAGAANYSLIQPGSLTANITGANVTVTSGISANNKVYDGTTVATISSNNVVLSGLVDGDTNSVRLSTNGYSASFASAGVGTGIGVTVSGLTLTGSGAANYSLAQPGGLSANITSAGVTISSGISVNNKVYDGTTVATISSNNVVLSGLLDGDTNNVGLSTNGYAANFAGAGAANGIGVTVAGLTLTGAAATNYTLTQPTGLVADITPKPLTINSVPSPALTSARLTNGVITIAWPSVVNGIYRVQYVDNLTNNTWTDLAPDITATGSTATQTNVITGVPQRFYRVRVLNPGLTANNKVYDGTTTATLSSNNVVLAGVIGGDIVTLSTNGYTANFASPNVGTNIAVTVGGLSLTGASATNYTLTPPAGLTANITPATLIVSAANRSRTVGLPNLLSANYSGFVHGEGTNVLTGAPQITTMATTNSPPGNYPIAINVGTLRAVNYGFAGFTPGTLTVVGAPRLGGFALTTNQLVFNWPTIFSQTYQLQYKDNLTATNWTPLGSPVTGNGNPISVTNNLSASPQRFFRLSISP